MCDNLIRSKLVSPLVFMSAVIMVMTHGLRAYAVDLLDSRHSPGLVAMPTESADLNSLKNPTLAVVDEQKSVETFTEHYPNGNVRIQREVSLDGKGNYVNHGSWKMWGLYVGYFRRHPLGGRSLRDGCTG